VCDVVAGESCPVWPGHPISAHWGIADPTATQGSDNHKLHAFRTAFVELDNRIKLFMNLPLKTLDRMKIQERLDAIGKGESASAVA
jgi:hypothetical protein